MLNKYFPDTGETEFFVLQLVKKINLILRVL